MKEILMNVNPQTWYILGGILAALIVASIIKKAITLAVVMVITAIAVFLIGPQASSIQEKYSIKMEENVIVLTLDGTSSEIEREGLKKIGLDKGENLEDATEEKSYLVFTYEDGETDIVELPDFTKKAMELAIQELNRRIEEEG